MTTVTIVAPHIAAEEFSGEHVYRREGDKTGWNGDERPGEDELSGNRVRSRHHRLERAEEMRAVRISTPAARRRPLRVEPTAIRRDDIAFRDAMHPLESVSVLASSQDRDVAR